MPDKEELIIPTIEVVDMMKPNTSPRGTINMFVPRDEALNYVAVREARDHQDQKWGWQTHTLPEWIAILGEEYGEAAMAGNKMYWSRQNGDRYSTDRYEAVMHELAQTAAVCLVAMKDLRKKHERVQGS